MPKRIQRKRTKGWRMPENAIYVGRPTRWGNPFDWKEFIDQWQHESQAKFLAGWLYKDWLDGKIHQWIAARNKLLTSLDILRGHDLACWCALDEPCHADVLLELANGGESVTETVEGARDGI
ncbi:MAG: DUF4326 domain-containing protein [Deltaproteobacteria bacterium]|nr:DUF4326 domain-containing protein [Deltaproteobacteria bacterium]